MSYAPWPFASPFEAVIEVEKNAILRRLRGHGDAVTCAAFAETDKSRCWAAGDGWGWGGGAGVVGPVLGKGWGWNPPKVGFSGLKSRDFSGKWGG